MQWNDHSRIPDGAHAFLGASQYHWLNYDDERLRARYAAHVAAVQGTRLHNFAKECILLRQHLPRSNKTLCAYVNDALGYNMRPEQKLVYSPNCFGTADAISFKESTGFLRIHDLKTGSVKASMHQLEIYAAQFCLEYGIIPGDIEMELRLYQNNDFVVAHPTVEVIAPIMDKIVHFDKIIEGMKEDIDG